MICKQLKDKNDYVIIDRRGTKEMLIRSFRKIMKLTSSEKNENVNIT